MRAALELQGRRALVTGGTKGIGEAVVARLLESGADVLTTARSRPSELAVERFVAADIATADGCHAIIEAVLSDGAVSTSSCTSPAGRRHLQVVSGRWTTASGNGLST